MTDYVVGLTGGIGSGKTAVSNRFAALGITVADADSAARQIVAKGSKTLAQIEAHFGQDILNKDGELNRAKLRAHIFAVPAERRWLESLTHGPIMAVLRDTLSAATSPYALLVLSAGSGRSPLIHRMLVVDAPIELQKQRVAARDGSKPETIDAIIAAQPSRKARIEIADDVINNEGLETDLDLKVEALHQQYLTFANHG